MFAEFYESRSGHFGSENLKMWEKIAAKNLKKSLKIAPKFVSIL